MASEFWTLEGSRAILRCAGLQARVQIDAPQRGIEPLLGAEGAEAPCRILALRSRESETQPPKLLDGFVRGCDLIAAYSPTPSQTVAPHIYWRVRQEPALQSVGIELIVSMQTSLLDSDPASVVLTEVPPGEIWHLLDSETGDFSYVSLDESVPFVDATGGAGLIVVRPANEGLSYAEMIHPTDFVGQRLALAMSPSPRVCIQSELFAERLEKGVIRRGRACGWFLPRSGDLQIAAELYRRFAAEPLPLTA